MDPKVLIFVLKSKREFYNKFTNPPKDIEHMSDDEVVNCDTRRMVAKHLIRRIDDVLKMAEINDPYLSDRYEKFLYEEQLILNNCKTRNIIFTFD